MRQLALLSLLACVLTLANALKPLHIDDTAYVTYAAHIAQDPLRPYDFVIYWDYQFHPANRLLAPPVVPYWLAGAMCLFGDEPTLWKLSLLPFHFLLAIALYRLFRRFVPLWAGPLTALTTLSPALLPATNFMLDVPALALGLAATVVFLDAADRQAWGQSVAAGLLAGLAMQTKYTAFVTPAVFLAYGLTHGRLRLALFGAAAAVAVFALWEGFVAWQHGDSHFLLAVSQRQGGTINRVFHLVLPLLTMTAGVAPGTLLLGLYALTRSGRWLLWGCVLLVAGILVIGLVPETVAVFTRSPGGQPRLGLESLLYGAAAALFWAGLAAGIRPLLHRSGGESRPAVRLGVFLLLWLGLEIGTYFALSPFPAARRVLGVGVVATLLAGRQAAQLAAVRRWPVYCAATVSTCCGLLVAAVDLSEALATQDAARRTAAVVARERGGGTAWFNGVWGLTFYTTQDGMVPLAPNQQLVRSGDLLVLAEQPLHRIDFRPAQAPLVPLAVVQSEDALPWRTVVCYYAGRMPLRHHEGPRLRLTVYRAVADFVPTNQGVLPGLH
jgi:hypothetical protein